MKIKLIAMICIGIVYILGITGRLPKPSDKEDVTVPKNLPCNFPTLPVTLCRLPKPSDKEDVTVPKNLPCNFPTLPVTLCQFDAAKFEKDRAATKYKIQNGYQEDHPLNPTNTGQGIDKMDTDIEFLGRVNITERVAVPTSLIVIRYRTSGKKYMICQPGGTILELGDK